MIKEIFLKVKKIFFEIHHFRLNSTWSFTLDVLFRANHNYLIKTVI